MTLPPAPVPPTERLYWTRPEDRTFTARVMAVREGRVALDGTLFYPEGGGQPCDAGTLVWEGGTASVTDVQKDGQVVWHAVTGDGPPVGAQVTGTLDWARRYRHSQRHTGEHLLAQAFHRVSPAFAVRAVSMRGPECTLDLAGQPGASHVAAAQATLMEALRDGLTLETTVVPAAGLGAFPLRRPPQVDGTVRVVLYRDAAGEVWEASACGGTHLQAGAQVAPVVVLKTERLKGDLTRVTFMAGEEATLRLSGVYADAQALARSFSVGVERLPERVTDQAAQVQALTADVAALQRRVAALHLERAGWTALPDATDVHGTLLQVEDDVLPALLDLASREAGRVRSPSPRTGARAWRAAAARTPPDRS